MTKLSIISSISGTAGTSHLMYSFKAPYDLTKIQISIKPMYSLDLLHKEHCEHKSYIVGYSDNNNAWCYEEAELLLYLVESYAFLDSGLLSLQREIGHND